MHGDGVHDILVRLVVLDEAVGAQVEHFDFGVSTAGGDAGAVGVELYAID